MSVGLQIEAVRVTSAPACYLCGTEGTLRHHALRDRLFGAPGIWSLLRCRVCGLGWLYPRPHADEIPKLHGDEGPSTVNGQRPDPSRRLTQQSLLFELGRVSTH